MRLRPAGLTLVELIIALALGSVLCLGISTLLVYAQRAYLQDEELARLQDNGRHAINLLQRELSMSGFLGRIPPSDVTVSAPIGSPCYEYLLKPDRGLEHFDDSSADGDIESGEDIPEACRRPGQYQASSDVILLRRTLDAPNRDFNIELAGLDGTTLYLQVSATSGKILRGSDVEPTAGSVWRYNPQKFFVRNYAIYPGDEIPTLCRQRLSPNRADVAPLECLVEGVEMLQVGFGLDTDGDRLPDRYLSNPDPAALDQAVFARIHVLMRGHRQLSGYRDERIYRVGELEYQAPGDGYYRHLLSDVVLLRNSAVHRG